jgi:uncharacterized membrane protein
MEEFLREYIIPLHPKLTDIPIGLLIGALILEILSLLFKKESWHNASLCAYGLAVLSLPVVISAGFWEEYRLHLHHPVLNRHKCFAFLTAGVMVFSFPFLWFIKRKAQPYFRLTFLMIIILVSVLVTITSHYGGEMVFKYAVGVEQ